MSYHDSLIDKRVLERNVRKGFVVRREYEKFLSQLPDKTDNMTTLGADAADDDADDEN